MLPIIAYIARIGFIIVTTITFVIALVTFLRVRNEKSGLIMTGFSLLFAHGLISIPELFSYAYNIEFTDSWHLLLDTIAVLFILLGTLRD
jgi:hypothetical protein